MACGCIPIGSAVGAIEEIIGDTGLILRIKDFSELENILANWKTKTKELKESPEKRISEKFSYQKRKNALLEVLKK